MSRTTVRAALKVDMKGIQRTFRQLESIKNHALPAGTTAMGKLNDVYFERVRAAYRSGVSPASAPMTLLQRSLGKREGKLPATPKYASGIPLVRSGTLAALIVKTPMALKTGASETSWESFVQPGVPLPHGGISDKVAARNETGATITFTTTRRQRVYLKALMLGVAGTDEAISAAKGPERTITIRIPARPIWAPTFAVLMADAKPFIEKIFFAEMKKRTGVDMKKSKGRSR